MIVYLTHTRTREQLQLITLDSIRDALHFHDRISDWEREHRTMTKKLVSVNGLLSWVIVNG
jgi:hypothetical protein